MTILCVATYFKGEAFLRECRRQGGTVLLLTADALVGAEWPREAIDEIHSVPRDASDAEIRRRVDEVARRHSIDRIAALDDFDVEVAAMLREHLRVPGMGRTTASRFRDKLAMRMQARTLGIPVPEFSAVFTDREVADWAARVPEPSARVGGAFIVDTIEEATGINLWCEWAKVEIAGEHGTYAVAPLRNDYAGIVLTLARQEAPDMSAYTDAEIATTIRKDHHAGLIVKAPDPHRVESLIEGYAQRFHRDFFATAPPPERPAE